MSLEFPDDHYYSSSFLMNDLQSFGGGGVVVKTTTTLPKPTMTTTTTTTTTTTNKQALRNSTLGDNPSDLHSPASSSSSSSTTRRRYLYSLEANIARGMNIINTHSGCMIAAWIYRGGSNNSTAMIDENKVCRKFFHPSKLLRVAESDASRIRSRDVIFCPNILLPEFVRDFLPFVSVPFVLLTNQYDFDTRRDDVWNKTRLAAPFLIQSPFVLAWFCPDTPMFAGGYHDHPKVHSFPLGLKYRRPLLAKLYGKRFDPIPHFQKAFLQSLLILPNKTNKIFVGYLRDNGNTRHMVPRGPNLDYPEYLQAIANSSYTISPSGDRPECHRHYEAIGLDSIPLTQLDRRYYGHFQNSVIYNHTLWDLEALRQSLPDRPSLVGKPPNRNMVFEEYWMAHVEQELGGIPLRWWDVIRDKPSFLSNFTTSSVSQVVQKIMGRPDMNLSFPLLQHHHTEELH